MGGFLLGLVVGLVVGGGGVWFWLRRAGGIAPAGPAVAPEPALAAPIAEAPAVAAPPAPPAAAEEPSDEDMRQALDATKGLLDELEGRYRGRHAAGDEPAPSPKRSRAPRRKPPT